MDEDRTSTQVPEAPAAPDPRGPAYTDEFPPLPAPPIKPKLDVGYVIIGFIAPWLIAVGMGLLTAAITNAMTYDESTGWITGILGLVLNAIPLLLFFGFLAAWLVGRNKGNVRLTSFGVGGMWSYAAGALLALLAFGTCLIGMNQFP